jgi:catechol 2,3-dioxygenase-like lactoylglutathione lyase family enzyme
MSNKFKELIQFIKTGEGVAPGTPNRVTRDLDANIRFLRDLLEAAEIGETVFARDVTIEAEAVVGMPVYWDGSGQVFRRGLAQVQTDIATGELLTAESAHVWGVVYSKENSTLGCILLFGFAELDVSAAVTDDVEDGIYYLSGVTPGGLVQQRPPVSVPVLISDGQGNVLVNTQITDFVHDHVHYKFDLVALPAGDHTPPAVDEDHEITAPDDLIEGWLPADDPIFEGNAPAGAEFGYNLSASSQLKNIWPPVPSGSAVLQWDKGLSKDTGFTDVPDNLAVLDRNGIWWMSKCFEDVPWPGDLDTAVSESIGPDACPRDLIFSVRVWFTKLAFLTDESVVTSLATDDDRIEILCENDPTTSARTGPLLIRLALQFLVDQQNVRGFLAFKEFDPDTNKFNLGPIVEGLYALSTNITIVSESQQTINIDGEDRTVHQGILGISVLTEPTQEVDVALTRLAGVTEEFFEEVPYLGFPDDELTRIRSVLNIPAALALTSPKLQIRLRILGRAAGTLPALTVTGRRLPRDPDNPTDLPTVDTAVVIDTAVAVDVDEYVEVTSDKIDVVAGDIFVFTVERAGADGYTGELGILQQVGVISTGS